MFWPHFQRSIFQSRKTDAANQYKPVIQRKEEETRQHTENEVVAVRAYKLMNKEQSSNKVSNDIKPSEYKETESVTYETNVSNNKYDEFGSENIFKEESYIKSSTVDENNQYTNAF